MAENSLGKIAATGIEIDLKGQKFKLSPLTVNDLAELESFVRSAKIRDFMQAAGEAGIDPAEKLRVLQELAGKGMVDTDMTGCLSSMTGIRFLLWRALMKSQPDITIDAAGELVDMSNFDQISTLIDGLASGGAPENPPEKSGQ